MRFQLHVNGEPHEVEAPASTPLLSVLRDELGLMAARFGCGCGQCGACYVLADGRPAASCLITVGEAAGRELATVEGLARDEALSPVQEAFIAEGALQCGFCTSGMLISATALLARNPSPTDPEIREALAPHLCRCGVYGRVVRAVLRAAAGGGLVSAP